ncbi:bacillithiol biosynthesis cysteine-adding enzyme BshC [Aquibacillus kalidii]|uniref:bacillithiol biosynthesis cysteine-adding enzyme BshC n=1 Tax=Aquibacillus kalidii TaxID=2762597 RepID=UPI0016470BF1|nr:bacillithiol biosynthesis cysteine-adding enzyme BshC [Aquibacillus kalidii]
MRVDPIKLTNKSRLISDYINHKQTILNKFDYHPYDPNTFHRRVEDLKKRSFDRKSLVRVLLELNLQWGASESTLHNINRLQEEDSVVVIGGQQAGLLTGPLYTINKIISIIHLAREQELKLNVPVIPVFWIAGEDHDFDEINHIMMPQGSRMKKHRTTHRVHKKNSMSDCELDYNETQNWINELFKTFAETEHTKSMYQMIQTALKDSRTYVDFFAKLLCVLFQNTGLVLIDSGNSLVRRMESSYFIQLIERQAEISKGVFSALQQVKQEGYSVSVDVEADDAHLFYHKDGERVLLERSKEGKWVGKQNECIFSTEELINIARHNPELLSNNVVTRPLMQELLFPSLAFLGGPGEVAYWSILKPAFQVMEMKMPPVITRLSLSLIEQGIDKKIHKYALNPEQVASRGVGLEKGNWLSSQTSPPIELLADQVKESIAIAHQPLKNLAENLGPDLSRLAEKNLYYLYKDVSFLQEAMIKHLKEQYKKSLEEYDSVHVHLFPESGLQERMWNVFYFLNNYGPGLIDDLLSVSYDYKQEHYLVYL